MNKLAFTLTAYIISMSSSVFALGDVAKGQEKSAACIGCHGVGGNSVVPTFPKLAGQHESYLLKQLKDFKLTSRKDAIMMGLVMPLSDEDMANISAYYAAQKTTPSIANPDANIELGKQIYRGGKKSTGVMACIACHGPNAKGIPTAGFPRLASQHAAYTSKQLKLFRQDSLNTQTGANELSRTNDDRMMMINFTKNLTNEEIDAVSEYIASLN